MHEKAWLAASVERMRREHQTLLAGAVGEAFERMHILCVTVMFSHNCLQLTVMGLTCAHKNKCFERMQMH